MTCTLRLACLAALATLFACGSPPVRTDGPPPPPAELIVLQLNDVYEMNPISGEGGLARVATLRQRLLEEGPPVLTLLAGDFLSPSAIGLAKVDGERLAGEQMVACFNDLGVDYVTFGNHEFDVKQPQLLARIEESNFPWISANVRQADGTLIPGSVERVVRDLGGLKVGIFSVTLDSNPQPWVSYDNDYVGVATREVEALKAAGAQLILGLTHLDIDDDTRLAVEVPDIDLVFGGHEHENVQILRGSDFTPVLKADANARTVYVHRLRRDERGVWQADSELVRVDDRLPDDPKVAATANAWTEKAYAGFRADGLDPTRTVTTAWTALDGREATVRNGPSALTVLLDEALLDATEGAQIALYNGGSIRIDDVIPAGVEITEYDVLRILPFGGNVVGVTMTGALLTRVLEAGLVNKGKGGWLQVLGVTGGSGAWQVAGQPLDPAATYRVATSDFMLLGLEANLDFLTREAEGVSEIVDGIDQRRALIDRLAKGPRE